MQYREQQTQTRAGLLFERKTDRKKRRLRLSSRELQSEKVLQHWPRHFRLEIKQKIVISVAHS